MKKTIISATVFAVLSLLLIQNNTFAFKGEPVKGGIEKLTTATFKTKVFDYEKSQDWKYQGELPAIVDFYADWCGPCKMIAPILAELQKEYEGKIIIYKVDVDDEKELAQVFQTQSIPAILFIPKEGQPQMAKGALPKESFVKAIEDVLKVK
jgi:thioredoxin